MEFLQGRVKEALWHTALKAYIQESNIWDNTRKRNDKIFHRCKEKDKQIAAPS